MRWWSAIALSFVLVVPMPALADEDVSPPVLVDAVIDQATVRPGELVTARLRVDDQSRIKVVDWGLFDDATNLHVMPDRSCELVVAGRPATFACQVRVPDRAPPLTLRLSYFWALDDVGHTTFLGREESRPWATDPVRVDSPYGDTSPPVLGAVSGPTGTPKAGSTITFQVAAWDETGVGRGSLWIQGPAPSITRLGYCDPVSTQSMRCTIELLPSQPAGRYRVTSVAARDVIGYSFGYTLAADSAPSFEVQSSNADTEAPELVRLDLPDWGVERGQVFQVRITARDATGLAGSATKLRTLLGNADLDAGCEQRPDNPVVRDDCRGVVHANYPLGPAPLRYIGLVDPGSISAIYRLDALAYPDCHSCRLLGVGNDTQVVVVPRGLDVAALAPAVRAVEAVFPEVGPGRVLPVAVQAGPSVAHTTLTFVDTARGNELVVEACPPTANRTVVGSLCHLIVPDGTAPGTYVLDEVAARLDDGRDLVAQVPAASAPSFVVDPRSAAPAFDPPAEWAAQTQGGRTQPSFNAPDAPFRMPVLVPHGPTVPSAPTGQAPSTASAPAPTASPASSPSPPPPSPSPSPTAFPSQSPSATSSPSAAPSPSSSASPSTSSAQASSSGTSTAPPATATAGSAWNGTSTPPDVPMLPTDVLPPGSQSPQAFFAALIQPTSRADPFQGDLAPTGEDATEQPRESPAPWGLAVLAIAAAAWTRRSARRR